MHFVAKLRPNALSGYGGPVSSGLRERKKERTRATITRAALELFARDGFAATTVSDIAAAADVSPRTVFTYFAAKESIVFSEYRPSIDRLAGRLADRQPGETVVDALRGWLVGEEFTQQEPTRILVRGRSAEEVDFARLRERAIANDPDLWALQRRETRELERIIAEAVAGELRVAPDSLAAKVAGAATAAALLELNAYAARGGDAALESLTLTLDFLRAGVIALEK